MLGIMYSFKQIVQFYLELYFNYNKNLLVGLLDLIEYICIKVN